ncbi:MAG TPA: bifunctional hydroxymethylpyrimidine kinase/phosphomethylpyrimidine kinase [Verrucomicrobiae bacterium]
MPKRKQLPVALTIAGSDSGGGAGIQADLKTFAALGIHGTSAITCLTAQNPERVLRIEACSPEMLRRQIEAVFQELPPAAVKTGMLFSAENVSVVTGFFKNKKCRLVVDPILVSTSGAKLLEPSAIKILMEKLLPLATLVTPNLAEAEMLSGQKISSVEAMRAAAREIHSRFGCAVLLKGGHLPFVEKLKRDSLKRKTIQRFNDSTIQQAVDIFFDGKIELLLSAPFVKGIRTHGTGCTYSAAITGYLALGHDLPRAVGLGKEFVTQAIAESYRLGKHFALNHSANP